MKSRLDTNTLLAFSEGDKSAFNTIYNRYYNEILYFTYKLTASREEAEDITIETFTKLHKLRIRFTTENNIRAFLYITARNNSLNYLRNERRHKIQHTDFSDTGDVEISDEVPDLPSQHAMLESLLLKEIYDAVEELPERCRDILQLYLQGLDSATIAKKMGIATDTVRSQKRRALDLLRDRFSNNQLALVLIAALDMLEVYDKFDFNQLFT